MIRTLRWLVSLCILTVPVAAYADEPKPLEFHVTFDPTVSSKPFTGRVYVMLSRFSMTQPPAGINWFKPEPFFALDVSDLQPGKSVTLKGDVLACPAPLAKLPRDTYYVTAVMDFDQRISFTANEGNGYSKPVKLELDPKTSGVIKLTIDQIYHERKFKESDKVKVVDIESKLLSDFHGRPIRLRAAVILPKAYGESSARRFPTIYEIPGFGGDHSFAGFYANQSNPPITEVAGIPMLYVVLDPLCRTGHHVFADSDNNGPYGKALTTELIPHIEKEFLALAEPSARFVTGHSSGGWSSLWLQVTYPDFFGGTWSTAPDPVDFRDFQRINIYKPGTNMFKDEAGQDRPIARNGAKPFLFYKPFSDMEVVMGHGGQLGSFEAVFSERGSDGRPRKLWDRNSGAIDLQVAKSWERYDIRLVLERNWKTLGPKLGGKLHVYMGGNDTFYLDGATALLKEALAKLGGDAAVEIFPGKDHSTLMDKAIRERIAKEMAAAYRKHHPDAK
jgi:hypothetical protein